MLSFSAKQRKETCFFYVTLTTDRSYNHNSIVQFNKILYNEGNYFNTGDVIFVAPSTGVYPFSWTTQTHSGKYVNTRLSVANIVNETMHMNLDSSTGRFSSTRIVICTFIKDDYVWIQTSTNFGTEYHFDDQYDSRSSVMGVLFLKGSENMKEYGYIFALGLYSHFFSAKLPSWK